MSFQNFEKTDEMMTLELFSKVLAENMGLYNSANVTLFFKGKGLVTEYFKRSKKVNAHSDIKISK